MMARKFQERKMLTHRQLLKLVMWELGFVRRQGHFYLAKIRPKVLVGPIRGNSQHWQRGEAEGAAKDDPPLRAMAHTMESIT